MLSNPILVVGPNSTKREPLVVSSTMLPKLSRVEYAIIRMASLNCDANFSRFAFKQELALNRVTGIERTLRRMKNPATCMVNIDGASNKAMTGGTVTRGSNNLTRARRNVVITVMQSPGRR
jgi:hypothetical protein